MKNLKQYGPIVFIIIFIIGTLCPPPSLAQRKKAKVRVPVTLKSGKEKTTSCQLKGKRWRRATRRTQKQSSSRGGRKGSFQRSATKACKSLVPPSTIDGIEDTPSLTNIVVSLKGRTRSRFLSRHLGRKVVGTPPALQTFPNQDVKNLFWREGVVDRIASGSPTVDDCFEFYGGANDGQSSGFPGCLMAQETARSFENLFRSATSLCYLRSIPSVGVGGGVSVLSGEDQIPNGDFTSLFSAPSGDTIRTIEFRVIGISGGNQGGPSQGDDVQQRIFIQPHTESRLSEEKNQYGYDIGFCRADLSELTDYETTTIGQEGKVTINAKGSDSERGASFETNVTGYLSRIKNNGEKIVSFNPRLKRSAEVSFLLPSDNEVLKASLELTPNDQVFSKTFSRVPSIEGSLRGYSIIQYTGFDASDIRFLAGAYKDEKEGRPGDAFQIGVEFRTDKFLSAPNSSFVSKLNEVDLLTDSFYTDPVIDFSQALFDCSATSDIVVVLDFREQDLQQVAATCESEEFRDMEFCDRDEDVQAALDNFDGVCNAENFF